MKKDWKLIEQFEGEELQELRRVAKIEIVRINIRVTLLCIYSVILLIVMHYSERKWVLIACCVLQLLNYVRAEVLLYRKHLLSFTS
jgi:hypothetical protein